VFAAKKKPPGTATPGGVISLPEMELAAYSDHYYTRLPNFVNISREKCVVVQ
jgi:hypothetical protein